MPAVTHNLSHSQWLGHEERQENGHTMDSHETIRRPGLCGRHQHRHKEAQTKLQHVADEAEKVGLQININKTEVM